jgi:hypothetical protein
MLFSVNNVFLSMLLMLDTMLRFLASSLQTVLATDPTYTGAILAPGGQSLDE